MCTGMYFSCWERDPSGTPTPPGHSSTRQVGTCWCPRSTGAGGRGVPARAAGWGQPRARQGVRPWPSLIPCPAPPMAFVAKAKPFGGRCGVTDTDPHESGPAAFWPTSLPLLGCLAQLELLSHPPTASAAASYQLWVQSRLEPSERFLLVPVEECLEQAELVLQLLMLSSR